MIKAYFSHKMIPTGEGSGNFSMDLWSNVRASRSISKHIGDYFKEDIVIYNPYDYDMLVHLWERDEISTGEIATMTTAMLNFSDLLIVDSDANESSEITMDIEFAVDNRIPIVYTYQHVNVLDKFNEVENIIRKLTHESN